MIKIKIYSKLLKIAVIISLFVLMVQEHGHAQGRDILPRIFADSMVLQRGEKVPVWGWTAPGTPVEVRFADQIKKTQSDIKGYWKVYLSPMKASFNNRIMEIRGREVIRLKGILVGDVWLCSGQSNMEYPMRRISKIKPEDCVEKNGCHVDEIEKAHNHNLRIFLVNRKSLSLPDSLHRGWNSATADPLRSFSAVGYFFGKELTAALKDVPIGVIASSVSGSRIEPWAPASVWEKIPSAIFPRNKEGKIEGDPGKFYEPMIAPLIPYALKGFVWYQGESNCFLKETLSYSYKLASLIEKWRSDWHNEALPFYYVQIAPFQYSATKGNVVLDSLSLPSFWEAQALCLNLPHTAMAVTMDLNADLSNLHPHNKWDVGKRLAMLALHDSYGEKTNADRAIPSSITFVHGKACIHFANAAKGLKSTMGKFAGGFELAGPDHLYQQATARIVGTEIWVYSKEISNPVYVRYAWKEGLPVYLRNSNGIPVIPFRSDNNLKLDLKLIETK